MVSREVPGRGSRSEEDLTVAAIDGSMDGNLSRGGDL